MKQKQISASLLISIAVVLPVIIAVYFLSMGTSNTNVGEVSDSSVVPITQDSVPPAGDPVFVWSYSSYEKEEIPYVAIGLNVNYPNAVSKSVQVDTVEGYCNDYPEQDPDVYKNSTMIICYFAGIGRYYKIIESDGIYLVQRKVFEEGSPEYDPPDQKFETVVSI